MIDQWNFHRQTAGFCRRTEEADLLTNVCRQYPTPQADVRILLRASTTSTASADDSPARKSPSPSSPASTAKQMESGSVWVLPGILPAIMSVAPNSPSARTNAKSKPVATPGQASGSITLQRIRCSE